MAAVEITISGMLYDKLNRTTQNVVLIGEASLTGLGVGGGPMPPGPGQPPGIWGPTDPRPTPPIYLPPGYPGAPPGTHPMPPIFYPPAYPIQPLPPGGGVMPPIYYPPNVPPELTPPEPPKPGDPTEPVPPPPGSGGWPTQSIAPPPFLIVNYPGIGPVVVAPPAPANP